MPRAAAATFGPGTAVEIASTDDGFRGSWFSGTVVRLLSASPFTKRRRGAAANASPRYLIQFDKLFEDEAGTKKIKEEVGEWQLRPLPPSEPRRVFKQGDDVDAYQNDGWWEGVITEELRQGKFEVYFRASKESLLFKAEDLRLHREWTNNAWAPPFDQVLQNGSPKTEKKIAKRTSQEFEKGTMVEVSSDEEGFRGAWFSAKIVEENPDGKYLVEYQTLRNDDDTEFLLEEINTLHIRPCPPQSKPSVNFKFLEEVDALYNDGWWVGVVSKVLGNSRFLVYFRDTNEELEIQASHLRPHQEWIGGEWVIASRSLKL